MYKLKLDEHGKAVLQDGKPVYTNEDGQEMAFDANEAFNKFHTLGEENKSWRLKYEKANETAKAFEGFTPEQVKANAEIAAKFKEHEAIKNGEIEKLKTEIVATSEKKLAETKQTYESMLNALKADKEKLNSALNDNILSNHFFNSKFIKENLILPPDIVKAQFGSKFKIDVDTGKVFAVGDDGSPLLSEKKLGTIADFEDAIEMLIKAYPHKDAILKSSGTPGGGMNPGGSGRGTPAELAILNDPKARAEDKLRIARNRQK